MWHSEAEGEPFRCSYRKIGDMPEKDALRYAAALVHHEAACEALNKLDYSRGVSRSDIVDCVLGAIAESQGVFRTPMRRPLFIASREIKRGERIVIRPLPPEEQERTGVWGEEVVMPQVCPGGDHGK